MGVPLVYTLRDGNLYGTERMALATAAGLAAEGFDPTLIAPPGPALARAAAAGWTTLAFEGWAGFAAALTQVLSAHRRLAFLATDVKHSLAFAAANLAFRRRAAHVHPVHGGQPTDEIAYGRKRFAAKAGAVLVAVSDFVRRRLLDFGAPAGSVRVVENFLPPERIADAPKRPAFAEPGVRRIAVVSRLEWNKRLDVLLDALAGRADVAARLSVRVLGGGAMCDGLRRRAAALPGRVEFVGFTDRVAEELASADLLVHTCPDEPFGLAVLEAMAADLPVLVPDAGGAGSLVTEGVSGFRYRAGDPGALADRLAELSSAPADRLNAVVGGARAGLADRFDARRRIADYRDLLLERLG